MGSELRAFRRIAYYPESDKTNEYISRMKYLIGVHGEIESIPSLKKAILQAMKGDFSVYDTVWINFIENEFIKSNGKLNILSTLKIFLKTFFICKLARRSVYVRHNHFPHATNPKWTTFLKRLIDVYESMFDVVFTHSGAEASGKKIYCPHPLYNIDSIDSPVDIDFALPTSYYVVFGRIVRYKKIEQLVDCFPDNQHLLIIGSVGDKQYASELQNKINSKANIIYKPGFIDDALAYSLIKRSSGLVLSHADDDMVVSGSFFYSLSIPKKVFAVQTKFLKWVYPIVTDELLHIEPSLPALCQALEVMEATSDAVPNSKLIENFSDSEIDQCIVRALA